MDHSKEGNLAKSANVESGSCFEFLNFLLEKLSTDPQSAVKYYAENGKFCFITENYKKVPSSKLPLIPFEKANKSLLEAFKNSSYYFYDFDRFDVENVISFNMYGYLSIKTVPDVAPKQILRRVDFLQSSPGSYEVIVDFTKIVEPMAQNTLSSLKASTGHSYKKEKFEESLKSVEQTLKLKNTKVNDLEAEVAEKKKQILLKKKQLEALKSKIEDVEQEALQIKKPVDLASKLSLVEKKPQPKLIDKTKSLPSGSSSVSIATKPKISNSNNSSGTSLDKLLKTPVPTTINTASGPSHLTLSPQQQGQVLAKPKKSQSKEANDRQVKNNESASSPSAGSASNASSDRKDEHTKKQGSKNEAKADTSMDDDGSWETVGNSKSNNQKESKRKNNYHKNDGSGSQGFKKNRTGFSSDVNKKNTKTKN